jgi:hypothetical protein
MGPSCSDIVICVCFGELVNVYKEEKDEKLREGYYTSLERVDTSYSYT